MKYTKKSNVKKPTKKNYRKSKGAPNKTIMRIVKAEIHKSAEDKIANVIIESLPYNSGVDGSGDVGILVPSIFQGVDSAERIGLQITGRRHNVMGHVVLNATTTATTNLNNTRVAIRLLVVSSKQYPNANHAKTNYANWLPSLLENGNTVQAMDGTIKSMYLPINRSVATVHYDKLHYVNTDFVIQNSATGGYAMTTSQSVKFFNISIPCKKVLKYNDLTSTSLPTNYGPVVLLSYCYLNGAAPSVLETWVNLSYVSNFYYEDS